MIVFQYEAGKFDLIVALDVMEHIETSDLVDFMSSVRNLLKPGGMFVARVPNGSSPWGLVYQYGDITHVTVLSPGRFQKLGEYSDLKYISFSNAYRVIDPKLKIESKVKYLAIGFIDFFFQGFLIFGRRRLIQILSLNLPSNSCVYR